MTFRPIYLDNNATTHCAGDVIDVMSHVAAKSLGNPASQHAFGREARRQIDHASDVILRHVNARMHGMQADQLLYCSGGTEANNLAILGLPTNVPGMILVSGIEHPSILAAAELAARRGRSIAKIPCCTNGIIDTSWLEHRLSDRTQPIALVSVMAANNETGVLQPVELIGNLCNKHSIRFHVDAVQCLGKGAVDFQAWQASSMTICAHKLHGPIGIGALIHRHDEKFDPQIVGGLQQQAIRSGTESAMLPAGFAQAIKRVESNKVRLAQMQLLRDDFEVQLLARCHIASIECEIIGAEVSRLPNTTCIAFPPHSRQAIQMALDMVGIACSTGSACESGSATPSHVLQAMNLPEPIIQSALRFSISEQTTQAEVTEAVDRILKCLNRLKSKSHSERLR
jgi:cysteine desulfurase